ncbi:Hypothetical predicted protein, partial [Paramuricea clavata]
FPCVVKVLITTLEEVKRPPKSSQIMTKLEKLKNWLQSCSANENTDFLGWALGQISVSLNRHNRYPAIVSGGLSVCIRSETVATLLSKNFECLHENRAVFMKEVHFSAFDSWQKFEHNTCELYLKLRPRAIFEKIQFKVKLFLHIFNICQISRAFDVYAKNPTTNFPPVVSLTSRQKFDKGSSCHLRCPTPSNTSAYSSKRVETRPVSGVLVHTFVLFSPLLLVELLVVNIKTISYIKTYDTNNYDIKTRCMAYLHYNYFLITRGTIRLKKDDWKALVLHDGTLRTREGFSQLRLSVLLLYCDGDQTSAARGHVFRKLRWGIGLFYPKARIFVTQNVNRRTTVHHHFHRDSINTDPGHFWLFLCGNPSPHLKHLLLDDDDSLDEIYIPRKRVKNGLNYGTCQIVRRFFISRLNLHFSQTPKMNHSFININRQNEIMSPLTVTKLESSFTKAIYTTKKRDGSRRNRISQEHRQRIVQAFENEDEDYLLVADTLGVNRSTIINDNCLKSMKYLQMTRLNLDPDEDVIFIYDATMSCRAKSMHDASRSGIKDNMTASDIRRPTRVYTLKSGGRIARAERAGFA